MSTFAIYTYTFGRIIRSSYNPPYSDRSEEEWAKRLETFRQFFRKDAPLEERKIENGKSTYLYDIVFIGDNIVIMKFSRLLKVVVTDAQLNDQTIEDYPWCYVVWDNRDGIQRMLVEQKPTVWPNTKFSTGTKRVANALQSILDDWLVRNAGMHFFLGDGPVYKTKDFWDWLKHYPQGFSRLRVTIPSPNLGRLMTLGDNMNELRNETGGGVDIELKASQGGVLKLVPENHQTQSLINLSSAYGSEIKAYPKDSRTMVKLSGDNIDNDVFVEIPNEVLTRLASESSFETIDFKRLVKILSDVKNLY